MDGVRHYRVIILYNIIYYIILYNTHVHISTLYIVQCTSVLFLINMFL